MLGARPIRLLVGLCLLCGVSTAFAQKAGQITKFVQPAMIVQPPARAGLPGIVTPLTAINTPIKWLDTLQTEDGGRIRAQLADGSILSIGSKSKLVVKKHDERSQQSEFELNYGKVRSQVVHLARPDSSFEVHTNTAVCGVLGTDDVVDADNPAATVVIVITGVVTVRSSNPNVVGTVQLTAGQTTTVTANQPPTQPQTANVNQLTNGVNGTTGTVDPEPSVSQGATQLQAGQSLTLDGRSSSGGLGSIASYQWAFTPNPFVGNVRPVDLTQPTLSLDTTGWAAGAYTGRLTVTNTTGKSAVVNFNFSVAPSAIPIPPPDATVTALAAAYESLQVRSFMNLFDPNKYAGYAALEQSITQSFSNIQSNRVFVQKASGQTSGASAILQVNFTTKFTPKNTALASPGLTPGLAPGTASIAVPVRAFARPSAGVTLGSISGSAGAVATFIIVAGPTNTGGVSPNNSLNYSVANLQNGSYTVTPVRNGFTFTPASRTVVIANGAAITGVDFTAQPQEQTVNEQATLRMELQGQPGSQTWMIVDIQGALGSAGLVGVPGTSNPIMTNSPGTQGSGAGSSDQTNVTGSTPTFSVASATTYNVFQGGSNSATPAVVTLTPTSGFSGNVAMAFTPPTGVTLVSGPATVNIAAGVATATGSYVFSVANTVSGLIAVPYTATSGTIVQGGFIVLNVQALSLAVTGAGQTAGSPLQVFSGNSASTTLALSPVVAGATYTAIPNVAGVTATVTPGANGASTVNVTSTDSTSGPVSVVVTATVAGGTASTTVFANRIPPVGSGLGLSVGGVAVSAGLPGTISVNVPFNGIYPGPVTVTAPVVTGFAITPATITLTQSGNATFNVSATGSPSTLPGTFTVAAGAYRATLTANFTIGPPFDFTLTPSSLTLTQGTTASVGVVVNETGGAGPTPVALSVSGLPAGITAVANGASSVTGNGSVSFNVTASATAALGSTQFTVTGVGNGVTHSVTVPLNITTAGSFTLNVTPSTVNVFDGGTGGVSVAVQTVGPFSGNVAISSTSGVAQASGPASITAGSSASYTVTTTGAGTLTFTGTSQGITQTAPVSVALVPGFTLSAGNASGFDGGSASVAVTVNRIGNFAGAVVVTPSASGFSFSPSSAVVAPGSNTANFTVTIPNTASSSTLNFSGVAQGGSLAVTTSSSLSLNTPFSLSSSTVTGFNGQTVQITVPVVRSAGFTGGVTVTPAGGIAGVTITPGSVTVDPNSTQATFVASIPAAATSGTINFNGTSAGLPQTAGASVTLTISAPFSLTLGGSASAAVAGTTVTTTANVALLAGFPGPVALSTSVVGPATAQLTNQQFSASGSTPLAISTAAGSTPGTSVVTVTATAGSFTLTASYTLTTQIAFSTQQNTPPNFTIFHGYGSAIAIGVNFSSSFTGAVATSVVTPSGITAATVAPINATGPVVINLSANQNAQSGVVMVTLTGGGNTVNIPYNVTAADPYSLSTTLPLMPAGSTAGTYVVRVTPASGFTGSVVLTPSINATGGTATSSIGPAQVVSLANGPANATFALTVGGGVTSINLAVATSSGGFTLNQSPQQVAVGAAYTLSNNGPFRTYSGVSLPFTVTVNYATGYAGSVTITPPAASGITSYSPTSAVATPGNPTVTFTATGTSSNLAGVTSSAVIAADDSHGNFGSTTLAYSVVDPYFIQTTLPVAPAGSTAVSYAVKLVGAAGFSGSVTIAPSVSNTGGSGSSTVGSAQTVLLTPSSNVTATFNVNVNGGATNINLGATTTTSAFTLVQPAQAVAVGAAYTMSNSGSFRAFSGVQTQFTVTVNYASGYTGSVTVTPAVPSNIATITPSSAVATPGSPTVTFTATGTSTNVNATTGNLAAAGNDGAGNLGTTSFPYSVINPYVISTTLPSMPAGSTTGTYSVTVTAATGFAGSILATPAVTSVGGTGSPSISAPQTLTVASGGTATGNFTVTINGGVTGINLSAGTSTSLFTLAQPAQLVSVGAAYTVSNSGPLVAFSGVGRTFTATVNFATGYTNSVTLTPSVPPGISGFMPITAVATPGSPTVTFTAQGSSTNPGLVNGNFLVSGNDGVGNLATTTVTYSVVDPYTISTTLPLTPAGSTSVSYAVKLTAATGFAGSVLITPSVSGSGGPGSPTIGPAQSLTLSSGSNATANFTVNVNGGATSINLGATTGTSSFSLTQSPQAVAVGAAYGMSNSGSYRGFSGVSTQFTVTVAFATGYTGSVTVTPTVPSGVASITPSSAVATPGSPTVTFTAVGTGSNVSATAGTLSVAGSDGAGNLGSTSFSYSVINPYIISTVLPSMPAGSTTGSYQVTLSAANGFNGNVTVTPAITAVGGTGSPSIGLPQTLALVSNQNTLFSFNVSINGGVSSINLSAATSTAAFTLNQPVQNVAVGAAYTMTNSGPLATFSGVGRTFSVTVNYASGYTGSVVVTPSIPPGITGFTPISATATPGSPTVAFTATGVASNPSLVSGTTPVNGNDGAGNTASTTLSYTVIDPYTLTTTLPTSPAASTNTTYAVLVTPSAGFSGSVTITPAVTGTGGTGSPSISAAQTIAVSGSTATANFTVTINPRATAISLSATTSTGAFTLNRAAQNVAINAPYTMTNNGPVATFSGVGRTFTVTVNFASGYMSPVTVTPSIPPGIAGFSPINAVATPGSSTVTFTATGSSTNPSLVSGTTPVNGTDVASNISSTTLSYTVIDPYSLSTTLPTMVAGSTTGTYGVLVHAATGFSGSVTITPAVTAVGGTGSPSIGAAQQISVTGGNVSTANFTVTINGGVSSIGLSAATGTGAFTLNQASQNVTVGAAYTMSNSGAYKTFSGVGQTSFTVTVVFASGFTNTVTVTPQSTSGIASYSPTSAVATPGSPTVTFIATGTASNPSGTSGNVPINGNDSLGNTGSTLLPYTVVDPYTLGLVAPVSPASGTNTNTFSVTVTPATGFSGSVVVTPTISAAGALSASVSGAQTKSLSGGTPQTATFTITIGAAVLQLNVGANVTYQSYTANIAQTSIPVGLPFSATPQASVKVFSAQNTTMTVTASFVAGYNQGPARVIAPTTFPAGISGILPSFVVVTPGSPTATFTVSGTNSNSSGQSGNIPAFTLADNFGNATPTAVTPYQVADPFTVSTVLPVMPSGSTTGVYGVTVTAATGFSGTATITTAVTAVGGSAIISPAQFVPLTSGQVITVNFNVTIGGGVTSIGLDTVAFIGAFTATHSSQNVSVGSAFTMSGGTLTGFSSLGRTFTVTVGYNAGYTGSVTVTPALATGIAAYSPPTAIATPGSPTVTFTATGTSSNALPGTTGNLNVAGSDGNGNTGSTTVAYTMVNPYAIFSGLPNAVASTTQVYTFTLQAATGFNGNATITPTATSTGGTGSPVIDGPLTKALTSGNGTTYNFNVIVNPGATQLQLGAATNSGAFSLSQGVQPDAVSPAYSMTAGTLGKIFSGQTTSMTVTVNFGVGYTGTVTVIPPALQTGIASVSPPNAQAHPGSNVLTFTFTGSSSNPSQVSGFLPIFTASDGVGNNANSNVTPYTVIDPYSVTAVLPTMPTGSSSGNYGITLSAATGFAGTVTVTPSASAVGGSVSNSFTPGHIPLTSGQVTTDVFTITIGGGVTSITLSASTTVGGFTLNLSPQVVTVGSPYSITANGPVYAFTGQSRTMTVTVNYQPGFTNSITVTPPSAPGGIQQFLPTSATVTPGTNTATFTVVGSSSIGPTPVTGTLTFTGNDFNGNNVSSNAVAYTAVDPFTVTGTVPSSAGSSTTQTYSVTVNAATGFAGTVQVTPSVGFSGSTITAAPSGTTTLTLTSGGSVTQNFTITIPGGPHSLSLSATVVASLFSLHNGTFSIPIIPAFTISGPSTYSFFTGASGTVSATITFAPNTTLTSVPMTAVGTIPTDVSLSPPSSFFTPGNPTLNFTATTHGSHPTLTSGNFVFSANDSQGDAATFNSPGYTLVDPYTVALASSSAVNFTVPAPGSNDFTVNVTYSPGFSGNVEIKPPAGTTFSVSPTSQTVTGTGSVTFTITGINPLAIAAHIVQTATPTVASPTFAATNLSLNFDVITFGLAVGTVPSPFFVGDNRTFTLTMNPSFASTCFCTATITSSTPSAPFTAFSAPGVNMAGGGSATFTVTPTITGTDADAGSGKAFGNFTISLTGSPNMVSTMPFLNIGNVTLTKPFAINGSIISNGPGYVYRGAPGDRLDANHQTVGVSFTGASAFAAAFPSNSVATLSTGSLPTLEACSGAGCSHLLTGTVPGGGGSAAFIARAGLFEQLGGASFSFTSVWTNGSSTYTTTSSSVGVTIDLPYQPAGQTPTFYNGNHQTLNYVLNASGGGFTGSVTFTPNIPAGITSFTPASRTVTFTGGANQQLTASFDVTPDNTTSISGGAGTMVIPATGAATGFNFETFGLNYNETVPFTAVVFGTGVVPTPLTPVHATANVQFTSGFAGSVMITANNGSLLTGITSCLLPNPFTISVGNASQIIGCYNATAGSGLGTTTVSFQFQAGNYILTANGYTVGNANSPRRQPEIRSGGLSSGPRDLQISPQSPHEGDEVTVRMTVRNDQSDQRTAQVMLLRNGTILDQQQSDVGSGASKTVTLHWKAQDLSGAPLSVKLVDPSAASGDDANAMSVDFTAAVSTPLRRERVSISARNENCTGVRFRSASQSSCGGSADLQIQPVITSTGRLEVQVAVDGGGWRDMGPSASLPTTLDAIPDAGSSASPQGFLEQGHTYLVTSRGRVSMVRVVRVRSSVNPKLAAVLTPRSGPNGRAAGDVLGTLREQNQADQVLGSAQIQIDLEWVTSEK